MTLTKSAPKITNSPMASGQIRDPRPLIKIGINKVFEGNFDEAEKQLNIALESDSKSPEVWYWLGIVHLAKGNREESLSAISKAMENAKTRNKNNTKYAELYKRLYNTRASRKRKMPAVITRREAFSKADMKDEDIIILGESFNKESTEKQEKEKIEKEMQKCYDSLSFDGILIMRVQSKSAEKINGINQLLRKSSTWLGDMARSIGFDVVEAQLEQEIEVVIIAGKHHSQAYDE